MPNNNYLKGKAKEWRTCQKLIKEGFEIAQRSAGSHSPIDVWAVNKLTKVIKLVQCKPRSMSEKEKQKINYEYAWLNDAFRVEFEVI